MSEQAMAGQSATSELAAFAAGLHFDDIPSEVIEHMKLCLLDTLGCALYGSTLPWSRILRRTMAEVDQQGGTPVWGTDVRLSSINAALANGTAVHAFELDDLHPRSIVHTGSVVAPAVFAAGPIDGRTALTGLVAGYEVAARVGNSLGAAHLLAGWHPTGTHGTLGAAAGAGSVLGLDATHMREALGIAGTQASGLMAAQYESMVKRMHAGRAAQSGLYGALLAARGFTGIADLFEASYGGYGTTFSPRFDPAALTEGLGSTWEVLDVGFKCYSTNGSCHPTIDALLAMRNEGLRADEIESITMRVSTATKEHVGWNYVPGSVTTAQMNLPYVAAVVVADGDAFVEQFSVDRIRDPELVEFSSRVHVIADADIDAQGDRARHLTRIEVKLKDGSSRVDERRHARGSASNPLTTDEVIGKFERLAGGVIGRDGAGALRQSVARLDKLDDLDRLLSLLAAVPPQRN